MSQSQARVTINSHPDVFRQAVAQADRFEAEFWASAGAGQRRCALCRKPSTELVRVAENGAELNATDPGYFRHVCPDCATERPTNLLPAYGRPAEPELPCAHLSAFLVVTDHRFGPVACLRCAGRTRIDQWRNCRVSLADLLARGIDPNRPHGDDPPAYADLITCLCERCIEAEDETHLPPGVERPVLAAAEAVSS